MNSMDKDIRIKRASFIDRSLQLRERFSFAHPMEALRAVSIYCCDHYGGMLWDYQSNMASQYFNSWSTCVKLAWGVPRSTHRYFLDYLAGGLVSARREILGRYHAFFRGLLSSTSREVNILARIASKDIRSTTARNLRLLEEETGGMTWSNSKHKIPEWLLQGVPGAPEADEWRITYLGKLLEQRDIMKYQGLEESEPAQLVQSLINSLCST